MTMIVYQFGQSRPPLEILCLFAHVIVLCITLYLIYRHRTYQKRKRKNDHLPITHDR